MMGEQGRQSPVFLWRSTEGLVWVLQDEKFWRLIGRGVIVRRLWAPHFLLGWGRRM